MDETSDGDFYSMPRFVTHIDDRCIKALSVYYGSVLPTPNTNKRPRILDLASSWISHLPETFTKESIEVIGYGSPYPTCGIKNYTTILKCNHN